MKAARAALLAGLLLSPLAHARVFQSLGPAAETGRALALRAGWTLARETRMEVNGAPSHVQVYAAPADRSKTARDIRAYYQALGEEANGRDGNTLSWLVGREKGMAVRYLLQAGANDRQTIVTRIAMTEEAFNASLNEIPEHSRLDALPLPANAVSLHHQKANAEGFEMEVSRVETAPEAALEGLKQAMVSDGWQMTLPSRSGLCLFQRGRSLAVVSVQAAEDGGTLITRGYKPD